MVAGIALVVLGLRLIVHLVFLYPQVARAEDKVDVPRRIAALLNRPFHRIGSKHFIFRLYPAEAVERP